MAASNETRACRWRAADAAGEKLHFFFSAGGFGHMPSFLMRGKMVVSVLKARSHLHYHLHQSPSPQPPPPEP